MNLKVSKIKFAYEKRDILNELSFSCKKGDLISIVGPNGSGKTTLLKCINKILQVREGNINIGGNDLLKMNHEEIAKKIAYVPQMLKENFSVDVLDVVLMGRTPHIKWKVSDKDLDIVMNIMKKLGIEDLASKKYSSLSGGQRQKVLIARALVQETDIYLLDEPISFLDIKNQIEVMNEARKVAKEENKIVIMVIHDLNMAKRYSDKVVLMDNGEVVDFGDTIKVLSCKNIKKVYGVDTDIINGYIIPR